jgi:hypothetical protein
MESERQIQVKELSNDSNIKTFVVKDTDNEITINIPFITQSDNLIVSDEKIPFIVKEEDNGMYVIFKFDETTDIDNVSIITKLTNVLNDKPGHAIKTEKKGISIFYPFEDFKSRDNFISKSPFYKYIEPSILSI